MFVSIKMMPQFYWSMRSPLCLRWQETGKMQNLLHEARVWLFRRIRELDYRRLFLSMLSARFTLCARS